MIEHEDPVRYIRIMFLLYSWGSLFEVPSKVPLQSIGRTKTIGTGCCWYVLK